MKKRVKKTIKRRKKEKRRIVKYKQLSDKKEKASTENVIEQQMYKEKRCEVKKRD